MNDKITIANIPVKFTLKLFSQLFASYWNIKDYGK